MALTEISGTPEDVLEWLEAHPGAYFLNPATRYLHRAPCPHYPEGWGSPTIRPKLTGPLHELELHDPGARRCEDCCEEAGDKVAAYLDEVRELVAERDKLVDRIRAAGGWVDAREFNAAQDRLAERVPRLLAALDAVLELAKIWERKADELQRLDPDVSAATAVARGVSAGSYRADAASLREAVSRALLR